MDPLLESICHKEAIPCRDVQVLSGGQVNAVYRVAGQYVIRIGGRPDAVQRLSQETALLINLAGKLPVPLIYAFGQQDGRVYQIQQYLPGEKLYILWNQLTVGEQDALVAELAGYLRILHGLTFPKFGYPFPDSPAYTTWDAFQAAQFQRTLNEIQALGLRMEPGFIELAAEYFTAHRDVLAGGTPVQVHGDLTLVNVLVQDGKISALLDFEYGLHAPADYELWVLEAFCLYPNDWAEEENENFCSADYAGLFPLLQRHYPEVFATPHVRERVNLYQLQHALGSYLAWRKDNLARIPPERMDAKDFYMARISNFVFHNGVRMFL